MYKKQNFQPGEVLSATQMDHRSRSRRHGFVRNSSAPSSSAWSSSFSWSLDVRTSTGTELRLLISRHMSKPLLPGRLISSRRISGAMSSICSIMLSNPSGLTALYPAFVSISRSSSHMRTSSSTTITHFTVYSTLSGVIIAMRYLLLERFTAVI